MQDRDYALMIGVHRFHYTDWMPNIRLASTVSLPPMCLDSELYRPFEILHICLSSACYFNGTRWLVNITEDDYVHFPGLEACIGTIDNRTVLGFDDG